LSLTQLKDVDFFFPENDAWIYRMALTGELWHMQQFLSKIVNKPLFS
jgi:hypothetical protein